VQHLVSRALAQPFLNGLGRLIVNLEAIDMLQSRVASAGYCTVSCARQKIANLAMDAGL
jgi:hypothetical protein